MAGCAHFELNRTLKLAVGKRGQHRSKWMEEGINIGTLKFDNINLI